MHRHQDCNQTVCALFFRSGLLLRMLRSSNLPAAELPRVSNGASLSDQTAPTDGERRRIAELEAVQSDSQNTFDWQRSLLL